MLAIPGNLARWAGGAAAAALAVGAVVATGVQPAAAEPGGSAGAPITAPPVTVLQRSGHLAPGYLFIGPKIEGDAPAGTPMGPEIVDNDGRVVWFAQTPPGETATDVRVQRYRGQPVLTYWQGSANNGAGHGEGVDQILDRHYKTIATVRAGTGLDADQHEFWLTDRNTALITSYHQTVVDASSVGGPANQQILEGVVQEIDVRTGRVLLDWHSLAHVPLTDSHQPLPASADTPWDYFHVNAVRPDTDGNLIVSARHTWTVYKIARRTGRVVWELGGRQSTFALGRDVQFAWQHDPKPEGNGTYRIFDNESNGTPVRPESRIITVHVDTRRKTATLLRTVTHPDHLQAASQGNSQLLPNGDLLVGWGQLGRFSEFDRAGKLIFDASVPAGYDTYRAYRSPWTAAPSDRPTLAVSKDGTVDAVWNGATEVRTWRLLGGADPAHLEPIRTVAWNSFDTPFTGSSAPAYAQVVALDAHGHVIGRSGVVPV